MNECNRTIVYLIPKKYNVTNVQHFCATSSCNMIFMILAKVLCNRPGLFMDPLISENQYTIIKNRSTGDGILHAHELVRVLEGRTTNICMSKLILEKLMIQ